jgi:AraC family transcriptional regulator
MSLKPAHRNRTETAERHGNRRDSSGTEIQQSPALKGAVTALPRSGSGVRIPSPAPNRPSPCAERRYYSSWRGPPQRFCMTILSQDRHLLVLDYVCRAGPHDAPFEEAHERYSLSFVRRGSFGCHALGQRHELTAGGFFVGAPGDAFTCIHDHHYGGDECLSFQFSPALADEIGADPAIWRRVSVPPVASLAVIGALAQAAAEGRTTLSLEEAGLLLASRFVDTMRGTVRSPMHPTSRGAKRAVDMALWIDAHAADRISLADMADEVDLSPFHFLRIFAKVLGTSPNQYLIACRLRAAAHMLAYTDRAVTDIAFDVGFDDLSNFQRTFKRAAGVTPGGFRRLARADRKILQVRLAPAALA